MANVYGTRADSSTTFARSTQANGVSLAAPSDGSRRRRSRTASRSERLLRTPASGLIFAIYDDLVIAYVLDGDAVLFLRVQERDDLREDPT
jgi:hypothetical protein